MTNPFVLQGALWMDLCCEPLAMKHTYYPPLQKTLCIASQCEIVPLDTALGKGWRMHCITPSVVPL